MSKANRFDTIKAAMADGPTRIRYLGGFAVIIVAAVLGIFVLRSGVSKGSSAPSEVAEAPDMTVQGHNNGEGGVQASNPAYDKLVAKQNADAAQAAKQDGTSAVPVIRASTESAKADEPAPAPQANAQPQTAAAQPAQNPSQQAYDQNAAKQQEEAQRYLEKRTASMKKQIDLLVSAWQPKDHASAQVREQAVANVQATSAVAAVSGGKTDVPTTAGTSPVEPLQRAGKVDFAVLVTAVNTDEPGPVTATVVQGKLAGATLLGSIEVGQNAQKAGLHFKLASIPGQSSSTPIDAWAMDADTARTALASDVDNHYFLRYGTFFASSFLGGYSDALLKGGQDQQIIASNSGTVVQTSAFTPRQLAIAGLANVGKQAATNLSGVINRPATITINSGIGIGILYMADIVTK